MKTNQKEAAATATAAALLALTGCVTIETAPRDATDSASAPSQSPTPPATPSEAETPQPGEGDAASVRLEPDSGVMYLQAIQHFSPKLERWVFDEEAGEMPYQLYTCAGTTSTEGVGVLEDRGDSVFDVIWEDENPMRLSGGTYTQVEITDAELRNATEVSSSDIDPVVDEYAGMCAKTGKAVAGFVL